MVRYGSGVTNEAGLVSDKAPPQLSKQAVATMGDKDGEIDLTWSRVRGAASYVIEQSPNVVPRVWTQKTVVRQSKAMISGCTPGTVYVYRVAAVGTAGQGPWSDESVKMSP